MKVLGISCFYHDSAVALFVDGKLIMALEEERISRIKHDNRFPVQALRRCLDDNGLTIADIDSIAFYEKPLKKLERALEDFVTTFPYSYRAFADSMPHWLSHKLDVKRILADQFDYRAQVVYVPHHLSHAAAAFYSSPYTEATVITIDGVGERETTCIWRADGTGVSKLSSIEYPHSLGLFYSTICAFLGFAVNDEEYKVMALAAFGNAANVPELGSVITIGDDGSFVLDMQYFDFRSGGRMWSNALQSLLGAPRRPSEPLTPHHKDIAAALQRLLEKAYLAIVNEAHRQSPSQNLCLGGGVALNAVANGVVLQHGPFEQVHIWGAAGDAGASYGAAAYTYFLMTQTNRDMSAAPQMLQVGTEYSDLDYEEALKKSGLTYQLLEPAEVATQIAELVARGDIVARFAGRMEFGARALGNRTLFGHPGRVGTIQKLAAIKSRESFRPFGGIFFSDSLSKYVATPHKVLQYPYMNVCLRAINKDQIPAIVHVDGTCRIQTVDRSDSKPGSVEGILAAFESITGLSCILNTSFNARGEPLVESPEQALETFRTLPIDHLFLGHYKISKAT